MSASLVGSEMCIRDSFNSAPAKCNSPRGYCKKRVAMNTLVAITPGLWYIACARRRLFKNSFLRMSVDSVVVRVVCRCQ
eukprot:5406237-Alexandrium_andersonii.AAC.1